MRSSPGAARCLVTASLAGAALTLFFIEGRVHAEDGARVSLRWSAPEGCPAGERVSAEVDRLLGPSGARPAMPIQASATVSVEERGYRVRLETSNGGPTRAREIKGASCAALADATALILALMIDPAAVSTPPADAGAPPEVAAPAPTTSPLGSSASAIPAPSAGPSPAPTTPAPALSARPPLPPAPDPPSRFSTGLFAMGALDLGTLPGVSPGVLVGLSVLYGPLRAELAAALWPAHDATLAARPTAGGAVDLYAGSAAACWRFLPGRFELGPCLGLEIGRLRAQGFGVSDPGQGSALWAAWRAGGGFAYRPIAPLVLGLRLEVAVPFARPGFVLSNVGTVHRPSVAAGRALAGVEVRF